MTPNMKRIAYFCVLSWAVYACVRIIVFILTCYEYGQYCLYYDESKLCFKTNKKYKENYFLFCSPLPLSVPVCISYGTIDIPLNQNKLSNQTQKVLLATQYAFWRDKTTLEINGANATALFFFDNKRTLIRVIVSQPNTFLVGSSAPVFFLTYGGYSLPFPILYREILEIFGEPSRREWGMPLL